MTRKITTRFSRPYLGVLFFIFSLVTANLPAADVTLQWDRNTEPDIAGYKVYYGTASRVYGVPIVLAGNVTTYTVTGLTSGTYYFAVTAYNTAGLESGFSNEVFTTLSGPPGGNRCDVNGDGAVDVLDLQVMINAILGINTNVSTQDLNADGVVDVIDLQILANVVLGVGSCP